MNNVAIITARGGSKRIPRKNIRPFLGKPIISYAISSAIASRLFQEVMVSTDDPEIASIGKQYGAVVPFMRSKERSDDFATTADVLEEVLNEYNKRGMHFENVCCIYPTAVLITSDKLNNAYQLMLNNKFDAVLPVVKFGNSVLRSLRLQNGKVEFIYPEYENKRTQDLPSAYYDSGQFYWFSEKKFLETKKLFTDNTGGLEIDEMECQDIDTENDWRLAEMKYKVIHGET